MGIIFAVILIPSKKNIFARAERTQLRVRFFIIAQHMRKYKNLPIVLFFEIVALQLM